MFILLIIKYKKFKVLLLRRLKVFGCLYCVLFFIIFIFLKSNFDLVLLSIVSFFVSL